MKTIFGARGQVIVGIVFTLVAVGLWVYYTFVAEPTVRTVFHISMLFGVAATYAIVATGLGYRATERVETAVVENIENADEVNVDG